MLPKKSASRMDPPDSAISLFIEIICTSVVFNFVSLVSVAGSQKGKSGVNDVGNAGQE